MNLYKYDWRILHLCLAGGIVIGIIAGLIAPHPFSSTQIACLIPIPLLFLFLGFSITVISSTVLYRRVNHPADPDNLNQFPTYWFSGEITAKYLRRDKFTGKLQFILPDEPIEEDGNPRIHSLYPGEVRLYVSTIKEI